MSKYYSKSTGGFYSVELHGKTAIPADAFEISDEEWMSLLDAQTRGLEIVPGTHGGPVAVEPAPAPGILARRDQGLSESDWLIARHRDEVELGYDAPTSLTHEQYMALQEWRRALRNITAHPDFPRLSLPERPV